MMYPFMTLPYDTEIVHSEMKSDGRVKVYIETANAKDGFHRAVCQLPDYEWEEISGYSEKEMEHRRNFIVRNAHLVMEFSSDGGILNTAVVYEWINIILRKNDIISYKN